MALIFFPSVCRFRFFNLSDQLVKTKCVDMSTAALLLCMPTNRDLTRLTFKMSSSVIHGSITKKSVYNKEVPFPYTFMEYVCVSSNNHY